MKKLSFWALMNPVKSIAILVVSQLLLTVIGIYEGIWLFARDIILPPEVFYAGMALFFIALIFYPIRRARYKIWKYNYWQQKTMDFLLVTSLMLVTICASNSDAYVAWRTTDFEPFARQIVLKADQSGFEAEKKLSKKHIKKALRQNLRKIVVEVKAKSDAASENTGKVVGMIALTVILMLLVAILACAAGCSGSGVGAALILLVGWPLLLIWCVRVVRRLRGRRKADYQPMPQQP